MTLRITATFGRFYLDRRVGEGSSSVTCTYAEGCLFSDGTVVVRRTLGPKQTEIFGSGAEFTGFHLGDNSATVRWDIRPTVERIPEPAQ